ncbi:copper amine oxidase N-terminal domain-containing protein [Tepidibacter aestuarii]|uniref:copper amine oxidase N-terminal domain-containing protein n=1 Tax=Tepidibacter aestuarii TaxID=2925782 RepID=UPI0020BD47DA|nr:copper amine oxidase N-terminal domain-containing protein [Tepidibacter aestuarii]CAH2213476.1 conserved exported protein of unknown function [Tepidibacter aestuarii]
MKKILLVSICFLLLFTGVVYANDINKITLNGKPMNFSTDPIIENGTTLVPMRTIFEALGATVEWKSEDKSVYAVKDDINVWLQQDNPIAKINDQEFTLAVAPKVVNGTTLVPIRFITETFGGKVYWNGDSKKIIIITITTPEMVALEEILEDMEEDLKLAEECYNKASEFEKTYERVKKLHEAGAVSSEQMEEVEQMILDIRKGKEHIELLRKQYYNHLEYIEITAAQMDLMN